MKLGNIVLIALGGVVVYVWAKNRKKTKNSVVVVKPYTRDEYGMPIVQYPSSVPRKFKIS